MKDRQVKSSQNVKDSVVSGFGDRLRQAFGNAKNAEIARKLKKSEPAINNYMKDRVPQAQILIQIANLTNCNIHWLLTNNGPQKVIHSEASAEDARSENFEKYADEIFLSNYLDEETQVKVRRLTNERNREAGEILAELVREGFLIRDIEPLLYRYGYRHQDKVPMNRDSVLPEKKVRRAR